MVEVLIDKMMLVDEEVVDGIRGIVETLNKLCFNTIVLNRNIIKNVELRIQ